MNPYKPVNSCAPSSMMQMAKSTSVEDLPPHCHSTVARAYAAMGELKGGSPQSVITPAAPPPASAPARPPIN